MSKVTIIGNGWGRSSNIYRAGQLSDTQPTSPEEARTEKFHSVYLQRDCSSYFTIDSERMVVQTILD